MSNPIVRNIFNKPCINLSGKGGGYGPELVTNGTFDTDLSGWTDFYGHGTASWEAGKMRLSCLPEGCGSQTLQRQIVSVEEGKTYAVSVDLDATNASCYNNVATRFSVTGNGSLTLQAGNGESGTFTDTFIATGTSVNLDIITGCDAGSYSFIDNVSLREVL